MKKSYDVKFNDNNLAEVPGVFLYYYDSTTLPTRDTKIHKLARRSLSIVTSAEYVEKNIPVYMEVCSGSRHQTEQTIINIKGLIQPQNGDLVVEQGNDFLKYTATMNEFNIEWEGATAWVEIVFLSSTPVAESVEKKSLFSFSTTFSSDGASFFVDGSFVSEPTITVVLNTVTGGSGSFSIFNAATNQGITISDSFTSGDIIEINSSNYTVLVNGANTDFEGLFPVFPPGAQRVGYSDTFTTRNTTVTGEANTRIV